MIERALVRVRPGVAGDIEQVGRLVREYFARRNAPIQAPSGDWTVAEIDGVIHAGQAIVQDPGARQRWVMATYCDDNRQGRLALAALTRYTHERADLDGVALLGVTEEDNGPNRRAMEQRGWVAVGTLMMRPRKES